MERVRLKFHGEFTMPRTPRYVLGTDMVLGPDGAYDLAVKTNRLLIHRLLLTSLSNEEFL